MVAVDFFRSVLPERIVQKLDFETLERQPGSYASGGLGKTMSDVVSCCRRTDGHGIVDISLLVEHKICGCLGIGLAQGNGDLKQALLVHYLDRVDFSEEKLKRVIRELPLTIKEQMMSTYELLIEKGIEKGAEAKSYALAAPIWSRRNNRYRGHA